MKSVRTCALILFLLAFSINPLLSQHNQIPKEDHLFRGITLYETGQFENAASVLNQFLSQITNNVQRKKAAYYLALARAANEPGKSELFFDAYIAEYPETELAGMLYIDLAHRSNYEGDLAGAVYFYEKALELRLNEFVEARVMYWNAQTYEAMRNYEQAHKYYRLLSTLHPRSELAPGSLFNQGRLFLMEERFDEASDTFEELRERYPADRVVRRIGTALGQAYYQQGRYPEAIEALRRVLATLDREQETKAVLLIAESYNYLDELNEASTWYRRYINLTEGSEEERFAHYGLGWVFHKQGVYHWAAESFSRAVIGDDDLSRRALYYKAVNEKLAGRYDLALESFNRFGRMFSTGPWVERAYYEWAILAFEIGDYVTAMERNLHLIRSGMELENPGRIYSLLGEAYFANGEYGRAIEAFEFAERYGESEEGLQQQARFQRGWVLYRNQAYREAQAIFENVYTADPNGELAGEALFWSADSYFNLEEYGPASARFQRFLTEFRGHEFTGAARYSLGWSYFKMGRFDDAIAPFRMFLSEYDAPPIAVFPYDTDTQLRLGDSNFALARYDEAINYYEYALASERGADYAKFQIANSYYRDDRTFESVRTFRQLINDFPGSSLREQAQYNIGYIYLLSGNYAQSVEEFQLMLRLFPNSRWAARSQYNIGNAYYNAGDNEKAIEAYQAVLDRYPRSDLIIDAVNGIQFAQEAAGLEDTSNEVLEDFLAANPQAGTADRLRFRQAERMLQTGDLEGAINAFRQYIRVTNNQRLAAEAWYNLGDAYERSGNRQMAVEAYQTILTDFSNSEMRNPALSSLGRMYLQQNNYSRASEYFETLARGSAQYRFEANIGLGNAAIGMNRFEQAKQFFQTAKGLSGDQEVADLGLGKVALYTNNLAEAATLLEAVADRSDSEAGAEAQYLMGRIYQQQRNHDAAIRAFANVRLFYGGYETWVANSLLGSIESNQAVGNRAEAQRLIDLLQGDYPDTEAARKARELR